MEKYQPTAEQKLETSFFDSEKAIKKEKTLLEKLGSGRAGKYVKALLLVSALTGSMGSAQEAMARPPAEQSRKGEGKDLTSSSSWSDQFVRGAEMEVENISSMDEAEVVFKKNIDAFVHEYYSPTKGKLEKGDFGMKKRVYTDGDLLKLITNTEDLDQSLEKGLEKQMEVFYNVSGDELKKKIKNQLRILSESRKVDKAKRMVKRKDAIQTDRKGESIKKDKKTRQEDGCYSSFYKRHNDLLNIKSKLKRHLSSDRKIWLKAMEERVETDKKNNSNKSERSIKADDGDVVVKGFSRRGGKSGLEKIVTKFE